MILISRVTSIQSLSVNPFEMMKVTLRKALMFIGFAGLKIAPGPLGPVPLY